MFHKTIIAMQTRKLKMNIPFLSMGLAVSILLMSGFTPKSDRRLKRDSARGYYSELLPVIKEKRAAFDKVLSNKEKKKVAELREELQTVRQQMKSLKPADRSTQRGEARGNRLTPEQRAQMQSLHWQRQRILSEAFLIADKHKTEVMEYTSEIRAKAKELRQSQPGEEKPKQQEGKFRNKRGEGKDGRAWRHHGKRHRTGSHFSNPAHFILFDAARLEKSKDIVE